MTGQNEKLQQVDNNNKQMWMNSILNKVHCTIPHMTLEEEMFAISTDYLSKDDCLDKARASSEEQFSIDTFI
jgi:hypothetical protein